MAKDLFEQLNEIEDVEAVTPELQLEEDLFEALPSDLAYWYKRVPTSRGYQTSPLDKYSRRSAKVRFSDASYEEITNKQALELTNNGRDKAAVSKLRLLFHKQGSEYSGYVRYNADGKQTFYRPDGVISDKFEATRSEDDKKNYRYSRDLTYTKRSGNETTDTREMPASFLITWADKIYLTDDDDPKYAITNRPNDWNSNDPLPTDTGSHDRWDTRRDVKDNVKWGNRELERVAEYEQKIKELKAKFDAGDLAKNAYEEKKAEYERQIQYHKDSYKDYMERAERYRRQYRDALARDTYKWSRIDLEKTKEKYKEIRRNIRNIQDKIESSKSGLSWGDDEAARTYENKVSRLETVKREMAELSKELDELNAYMADPKNKEHHDKYVADKAAGLDKKLADAQKELYGILGKNDTTEIGAQESLKEDVNDELIYSVGDYYITNREIRNSDEWKEEIKAQNITLEDIKDFYDEDFTQQQFDRLNTIMSKDWHTYHDSGKYYLELSDNHTLFDNRFKDIEDESGQLEAIYGSNVEHAARDFKDAKGLELIFLGRSGRHVCVELSTEAIDKLEDLKQYQKALEDQVIDNTIKIFKGEDAEGFDSDKVETEEGLTEEEHSWWVIFDNEKDAYVTEPDDPTSLLKFNTEKEAKDYKFDELAEKFFQLTEEDFMARFSVERYKDIK